MAYSYTGRIGCHADAVGCNLTFDYMHKSKPQNIHGGPMHKKPLLSQPSPRISDKKPALYHPYDRIPSDVLPKVPLLRSEPKFSREPHWQQESKKRYEGFRDTPRGEPKPLIPPRMALLPSREMWELRNSPNDSDLEAGWDPYPSDMPPSNSSLLPPPKPGLLPTPGSHGGGREQSPPPPLHNRPPSPIGLLPRPDYNKQPARLMEQQLAPPKKMPLLDTPVPFSRSPSLADSRKPLMSLGPAAPPVMPEAPRKKPLLETPIMPLYPGGNLRAPSTQPMHTGVVSNPPTTISNRAPPLSAPYTNNRAVLFQPLRPGNRKVLLPTPKLYSM